MNQPASQVPPTLAWKDGLPEIQTARLTLRLPRPDESRKLLRFALRNRNHVRPWEPIRPASFYTEAYWLVVPEQHRQDARRGVCFRFRAQWMDGHDEFIAHGVLRDIYRGDSQSCQLGYTVDAQHIGQGVATEMGHALLWFAFEIINLHRVEACFMPANLASGRVLQKLGFEREGLLRQSLRVNGKWEDHVLVAALKSR